jgi:hypothetical protein
MLAGLWTLLAMLAVLESYRIEDLQQFAQIALNLPTARPP